MFTSFRKHLGQAGSGDLALFYFSGHGHREQTPIPAFRKAEIDGKLGNLVCFDSICQRDTESAENTCLADKELRFLIHELSLRNSDILTIFDCCHSGDNTRNSGTVEIPANARKIATGASFPRSWEGFIFHDQINLNDLQESSLGEVIPEGNHIQLAACRDVELAWEFNGIGAFTSTLLDTLYSHRGRIRYHELHTRVLNRMRERGQEQQTPQIYVRTDNPMDRYRLFLTHETDQHPISTAVIHNEHEDEWRMDLGALHGVPTTTQPPNVDVAIYPIGNPSQLRKVSTKKVMPSQSTLNIAPNELDSNEVWRARVTGLAISPLAVFVKGESEYAKLAKVGLIERIGRTETPPVEIVNSENEADLALNVEAGLLTITRPHSSNPIIASLRFNEDGNAQAGLDYLLLDLRQIVQWNFLRDLEHRPTFPGSISKNAPGHPPVELRIFQSIFQNDEEIEKSCDLSKGIVQSELTHDFHTGRRAGDSAEIACSKIRMELENHSDRQLFCCLLYLSQEFGVSFPFFQQHQFWLLPGQQVDFKQFGNEDHLYGTLPNYVIESEWDGVHDYAKLIMSETQFEAETLAMDDLPEPGVKHRGAFGKKDREIDLPRSYWATQTVELFTRNPYLHERLP